MAFAVVLYLLMLIDFLNDFRTVPGTFMHTRNGLLVEPDRVLYRTVLTITFSLLMFFGAVWLINVCPTLWSVMLVRLIVLVMGIRPVSFLYIGVRTYLMYWKTLDKAHQTSRLPFKQN